MVCITVKDGDFYTFPNLILLRSCQNMFTMLMKYTLKFSLEEIVLILQGNLRWFSLISQVHVYMAQLTKLILLSLQFPTNT